MNPELDMDHALTTVRGIARQAGDLLREGRLRDFSVENKGEVDLVTDCDRRSEALVVHALGRSFPDDTVIGEEGTQVKHAQARRVWLVDPLDGTTNYAHRLPWYALSISLEVEGTPVLGVVHAPEMGWEFWAAAGRGAHLDDRPIRVSSTATLDGSLVATGFPYDRRTCEDNNVPEFAAVIRRCQGIRRIGVASLDCAMVAWGVLDAFWEFKLQPWDISAGALLVLEAGGRVTLPDGTPFTSGPGHILASNGQGVHDELVSMLAEVRQRRESRR